MEAKIWFTADLHGYHKNIAGPKVSQWKSGYRNFDDEYQMTDCIVQTINKYVQHDDILYSLGDWSFGGVGKIKKLRDQINCRTIHHLFGNHCENIKRNRKVIDDKDEWFPRDCFTTVQDIIWDRIGGREMFLSHYSHQVWPGSHKSVIHLFGHSHDSLQGLGKSMDVGVDVAYKMFGEYRPFSIDEIIHIMDKKQVSFIDRHDINTNVK